MGGGIGGRRLHHQAGNENTVLRNLFQNLKQNLIPRSQASLPFVQALTNDPDAGGGGY